MASDLAKKMAEMAPMLNISARVDSQMDMGDHSYYKDKVKRLKAEIKAAKSQISSWDAEAVAAQALKSLKADLASKQAQLIECESHLDMSKGSDSQGDGYKDVDDEEDEDGEVVEEGNPWNIQKRGGKYAVVKSINPGKGKVMGTHDSKAKAQAQRRALYANMDEY